MKLLFLTFFSILFAQNEKLTQEYIQNVKNQIEIIKTQAISLKNPVDHYIKIAKLYLSIEEIDNAIVYFGKAKEIEPKNENIYYMLAMAYEKQKNWAKAIENWQKVVEYSKSKNMIEIAKKHIKYLLEMK